MSDDNKLITVEYIINLYKIVGIHIKNYNIDDVLLYKHIIDSIYFPSEPPLLKKTCTLFNCVCLLNNNIKNKCITYKKCLKCYSDLDEFICCDNCEMYILL